MVQFKSVAPAKAEDRSPRCRCLVQGCTVNLKDLVTIAVARVRSSTKKINARLATAKKLSRRKKLSKLKWTKVLLTEPSMFSTARLMSSPAWNQVTLLSLSKNSLTSGLNARARTS